MAVKPKKSVVWGLLVLLAILATIGFHHAGLFDRSHQPAPSKEEDRLSALRSTGPIDSTPLVKRYRVTKDTMAQLRRMAEGNLNHEALFKAFDVEFPEDAYARYFPKLQQAIVHQSPQNHARIESIIREAEANARPPYQFQISASLVSLPKGSISNDQLLTHAAARRYIASGNAISAPGLALGEGQRGKVSSLREFHIPVMFDDGRISSDVRLHGFEMEILPEVVEKRIRLSGKIEIHPLTSQELAGVTRAFRQPADRDLDLHQEIQSSTVDFDAQPTQNETAAIICHDDGNNSEQIVLFLQATPIVKFGRIN